MPATTEGWYSSNSTRSYPIDDAATAVDDAGVALPPDIVVDLSVRFPSSLGSYLVLSAVAVTPGLVTVLFVATDGPAADPSGAIDASGFRPCAAVSVPQPVDVGRHYPVRGMVPGVAGWIVFGDGVGSPYNGRFSTAAQGQVLASLGAPYRPPAVTSLARAGSASVLGGTVTLLAGQDLAVAIGPLTIVPAPGMSGAAVDVPLAISFSLVNALDRDVFALYAGACQARPESGSCAKTPLQQVSGVGPDCDGVLTLQFPGLSVAALAGGSGAVIGLARGLAASCPSAALPDPDGTVTAGGDLCDGVIPSAAIDPTTCDPTPAPVPPPRPGCPSIFDDFSSLPYTPKGRWGDTVLTSEEAVGTWTVGLEDTPVTALYRGGAARLVKVAASAPAFDVLDTSGLCPERDAMPLDALFTTLLRPHSDTAASGVVLSASFPSNGLQLVWYAAEPAFALEATFAGSVSRLAAVALDPSTFTPALVGWAELTVQVREAVAGTTSYRIAATLTPAPGVHFPAGTPPPTLDYTSPASPGALGHLFGLVSPAVGASFAYVFLRDRTPTNGIF